MIFFLDSRLRCFTSEIRVDDFTHMRKSNTGPCDTRSVCRNLHIESISTSHVKPGTRAPATTMGHIGTFWETVGVSETKQQDLHRRSLKATAAVHTLLLNIVSYIELLPKVLSNDSAGYADAATSHSAPLNSPRRMTLRRCKIPPLRDSKLAAWDILLCRQRKTFRILCVMTLELLFYL